MKSWYQITNKSDIAAEVCIYDEIGMFGITARDFLNELKSVGNRKITLRINSPGGEVFDGLAIYNRLSEHAPGVEVKIDGIAASMASVIAMVGSPITMAENALLMIHNPNGICMGDATDMRDLADMLDKVKGSLTGAYERKTGKTSDEITAMMNDETWMNAEEAKAHGFIDEITQPMKMAAKFDKLKTNARIEAREKTIDNRSKTNTKPQNMENESSPEANTEAVAPVIVETPAAPEPPVAAPDVAAISAKAAADAVVAERQRVTSIRAWAGDVSKVQNIDLAASVTDFIDNGKTLAEFKDHVILNTFKPAQIITKTDSTASTGNTMKREEFEKLSPFNQSEFCRNGGKLTD